MSISSFDPYMQFIMERPDLGRKIKSLNAEGQEYLHAGDTATAKLYFSRILEICSFTPMGNNNMAVCHFQEGDYAKAAESLQRTLKDYPEYVFSLAMLARTQLRLGDRDEAVKTLQKAIAANNPRNIHRGDEIAAVEIICEAFAELEDARGLLRFFTRHGGHTGIAWPVVSWAGVAAFNLGRFSQAKRYWVQALQRGASPIVETFIHVADLRKQMQIPEFQLDYRLHMPSDIKDLKDPDLFTGTMKAVVAEIIWGEKSDAIDGFMAFLSMTPDPWAEELLWSIVKSPRLSQDVKTHAAQMLLRRGAIAEGETFTMNVDGVMREVEIEETAVPAGVDPRFFRVIQIAAERSEAGDKEGALAAYEEAITFDPEFHEARFAAIFLYQDLGRWDEAEQLLQEIDVSALDEDYVWRYWGLMGESATSRHEFDDAQTYFTKALEVAPDELKDQLREIVERGLRAAEASSHSHADEMHQERRHRLLRQSVRPDMLLVEAYDCLTKDNLIGMARRRELRVASSSRKGQIAETLAKDLTTNGPGYADSLDAHERAALLWLRDRGGVALFAHFEARYGDPDDNVFWEVTDPVSVANLLWSWGWIAVGTWRGHTEEDVATHQRAYGKSSAVAEMVADRGGQAADKTEPVIVVLPREVNQLLAALGD